MVRFFFAFLAALLLGCLPGLAQNRSALEGQNNTAIRANGRNAITGPLLNGLLGNIITGTGNQADGNIWSGTNLFSGTLPALSSGTLAIGGLSGAPTLGASGEGALYLSSINGLSLQGEGPIYDAAILNKLGAVALGVQTGTANITLGTATASQAGGILMTGTPGTVGNSGFLLNEHVGGTCLGNCGAVYIQSGSYNIASTATSSMLFVQGSCCGTNGAGVAGYSAAITSLNEVATIVTATFANPLTPAVAGETVALGGLPGGYPTSAVLLSASASGGGVTTVTFTGSPSLSPCSSNCGTITASFAGGLTTALLNESVVTDPMIRTGNGTFWGALVSTGHVQTNSGGFSAAIASISEPSGTTATITFPTPTPVPVASEVVWLSGATPSGYNTSWIIQTASNVGGTSTITITTNGNLGNGSGGTATVYMNKEVTETNYAEMTSAGTYWAALSNKEFDYSIASGAHVHEATGMTFVLESANQQAPDTGVFPAFGISAQPGAVATVTCGYCFGNQNGFNAMSAGASLLGWIPLLGASNTGPTVTNGFFFPTLTFTGFAYDTPGATIDGSGNASFNSVSASNGVSCPTGSPSSSFATSGGIVTHC